MAVNCLKAILRSCWTIVIFLKLFQVSGANGQLRYRRGLCPTRNLDIKNGDYSIRSGNSVVEYRCNDGFMLYGTSIIICFGTQWSEQPPMCIAPTCPKISPTSVLRVHEEYTGAIATFSCAVGHKLVGDEKLICTGINWNKLTPKCKPWTPPTSCDFETEDLCGWIQHDKDHQDWTRNTGSTPTSRTGPVHDHTLGPDGEGHYMFFETSTPTRDGHEAILESPLYATDLSDSCFSFWYHILGEKDIGWLEVYVKPEGNNGTRGLKPGFTVNVNMGEDWFNHTIPVPKMTEPFQIWILARRGASYRSDFAIDDLSLHSCPGATTAKAETKVTKIVASTEPDTTSQTTKQTTTNATTAQTKATTTTPKPSTTTILSTTTTTTSFTTAATTKTPIATEVPKASTHVPQTTYENISTLQNADKTNSESSSSDKVTMQGRTYVTHMPSEDLKRADGVVANKGNSSGMGTVGIVFIVLGLVVVAVASAIVVKVWYKRRVDKRLDYRASLHSTNPLYDEIENQEKELTD